MLSLFSNLAKTRASHHLAKGCLRACQRGLQTLVLLGALCLAPTLSLALGLEDIAVMLERGIEEQLILGMIQSSDAVEGNLDEALERLQRAGASEALLSALKGKVASGQDPLSPKDIATQPELPLGQPELPLGQPELPFAVPTLPEGNLGLYARRFFQISLERYQRALELAQAREQAQRQTQEAREQDAQIPEIQALRARIPKEPENIALSCLQREKEKVYDSDSLLQAEILRCQGEALATLELWTAASLKFEAALAAGPSILYDEHSLKLYLEASHHSQYPSQALADLPEDSAPISIESQAALRYHKAYHLAFSDPNKPQDKAERASALLADFPTAAPAQSQAKAKILFATLAMRPQIAKFKSASKALQEALELLKDDDANEALDLRDNAWLALARLAFENHAYDMAQRFYRELSLNSPQLAQALLEQAWVLFFDKKANESLALTHALRAPLFQNAWLLDLPLIEASAYLALCHYDRSQRALDRLQAQYLSQMDSLRQLQSQAGPYYPLILRHAQDRPNSPLPELFYRKVLNQRAFYALHRRRQGLDAELLRLSPSLRTELSASYEALRQSLDKALEESLAVSLQKALDELHAADITASQLQIEIRLALRKREADCLKRKAAGQTCLDDRERTQTSPAQPQNDELIWPFEGEFWRDELRQYQSQLRSLCE